MPWDDEDDDEPVFGWVDEDENEIPPDREKPLSSLRPIASIVFLILIALFVIFMLTKAVSALRAFLA